MVDWIDSETATAKFGTRKAGKGKAGKIKARETKACNARLKKRFQMVLESMINKPSLKFPAGCNGRAEVKAAYRFLDNEHVTAISILAPHRDATIERIRADGGPDRERHNGTRHHAAQRGDGRSRPAQRFLACRVSRSREPGHDSRTFGVGRGGREDLGTGSRRVRERCRPKAHERRAKSIEEKESFRWVEGYSAACHVAQEAPGTHIISLADSEGDIYEYLLEGQAVEGAHKASFIIRACQNRALVVPDETPAAESHRLLREQVASTPILAQRSLEIRGRDPKSKDDRKRKQPREPRTAVVTIQAARVKLRAPSRPGGKLDNVEVNVVLVTELNPPPGAEPIEWVLLTDLPIGTVEDVLRVIDYYTCRWQIEIYFRVLKSGCKVEESQLEAAARFEPYLALNMIVAWRIMHVMMLGRECPDLPCDIAFDDDEWQAVYAAVKKETPPSQPPPMKTIVGMIASLGGWLGRKCDGPPGPKAMWIGMQRMTDLALGWCARAEHSGDAPKEIPSAERRRE